MRPRRKSWTGCPECSSLPSNNRAYVYYLQGDFPSAERVLKEAPRADSGGAWARYLLAATFVGQKRAAEAEALARQFLVENAGFHGYNLLAWILIVVKGDLDEGMPLALRALSSEAEAAVPMTSTSYENLARAHPYFPLPEHTLGLAHLQRGQFPAALGFLERATALAPLRQGLKGDLERARGAARASARADLPRPTLEVCGARRHG